MTLSVAEKRAREVTPSPTLLLSGGGSEADSLKPGSGT